METTEKDPLYRFRWRYIVLPLAAVALSIIISLIYYFRLPAEVSFHFDASGAMVESASRGGVVFWAIAFQVIFALCAFGLTQLVLAFANRFVEPRLSVIKPEKIILFMGNMPVLVQLIFIFATLDIFSYNSSKTHLISLWIIAYIIIGLSSVLMTVLSVRAWWLFRNSKKE